MTRTRTRREFLSSAGALCAAHALLPAGLELELERERERERARLVLLGTMGGPRPQGHRAASSQVLLVGGDAYVIDCGDGVCRQLVKAGVRLRDLRKVFITHHHSDHNADYDNLLLLAWASGLETRVDTYGPPPLARMTDLVFELHRFDIETRIADEGRVPLRPLVAAHEVTAKGLVCEDEHVKVTAALAHHPPIRTALAYRFDTEDRSFVFSGDTAYSENVLELARGADVLVHEALYRPGLERTVQKTPNATALAEHIVASHTEVADVGRLAEAAGVQTLVLSHLVPGDDPLVTEATWLEEARKHFSGDVIVAEDLMEI